MNVMLRENCTKIFNIGHLYVFVLFLVYNLNVRWKHQVVHLHHVGFSVIHASQGSIATYVSYGRMST